MIMTNNSKDIEVSRVGFINNQKKDNKIMKTEIVPVVQENAMSEAQIEKLTTDTVAKLNVLEAKSITAWLEMGKLVHDYIYKLDPKGQFKTDPYKKLSEHPDSYHKSSQLRNYEACYKLWVEQGGKEGAPKVSMTHLIQVLPKKYNYAAKRALLLKAEKEKMSVSELKAHISKEIPSPKPAITHNYGKDLLDCLRSMGDLVSRITIKDKQAITKETRSQIVFSIQHLITLNVISFEEINAPAIKKVA